MGCVVAIPERYRRRRPTVVLEWRGGEVLRSVSDKAFWAAIQEAQKVLRTARGFAPRRTGTLIRSSTITLNKRPPMPELFEAAGGGKRYTGKDFFDAFIPKKAPPPGKHEILITFNTPYAIIQHERTDYYHRVGGPKYLQRAFEMHVAAIQKRLGKAVEAALVRRR